MRSSRVISLALVICLGAHVGIATAVDVGIVGRVLVIQDRFVVGDVDVKFVTQDPAVTKGSGTDPAAIDGELQVSYDTTAGTFLMPQGVNWLANNTKLAAYTNGNQADSVSFSIVKPGRVAKVKARTLGETPIDISMPPTGSVLVVYRITNGAETFRHCTSFNACEHKADTGVFKLVCRRQSTPTACP